MSVRKTIAIIGDAERFCPALTEKLSQQDLRLLFVSAGAQKNLETIRQLENLNSSSAEIEVINCEKEGCWEADIIALTDPGKVEPQFLKRIKQVATQKIVLLISEEKKDMDFSKAAFNLQELLPNSRVVQVSIDPKRGSAAIYGRNPESRDVVGAIFERAGYELNN